VAAVSPPGPIEPGPIERGLPEHLELPGGRSLTVRAARSGDEERLAALYAALSPEDRHKRFFGASQPSARMLHSWVHAAEHGGVRLVAERDDGRIVGDAGVTLEHDGGHDAELDITVAADSRGWLGAYLLDTLVCIAGERGIDVVRAEVLRENVPMLTLLRARDAVSRGRDDPTTVSLLIGATDEVPHWPERRAGSERVLVESPSADWHAAESLRSRGIEVIVCRGPSARPHAACPALEGRPCPLVEEADAVVFALPLADEKARAVLTSHAHRCPRIPLCVEADPGSEAALPPGTPVLDRDDPLAGDQVLEALGRTDVALPHRRRPET
jgi:hypothetical protein